MQVPLQSSLYIGARMSVTFFFVSLAVGYVAVILGWFAILALARFIRRMLDRAA